MRVVNVIVLSVPGGIVFYEEVFGHVGPVLLKQPAARAAQPFMAVLRFKSKAATSRLAIEEGGNYLLV
jgi:hypothetical protein